MNEKISLGGVPIGFGSPESDALASERAAAPATIAGFFVGAIGGAILGNAIHKGAAGGAVGAITGGLGGGVASNLLASRFLRKSAPSNCDLNTMPPDQREVLFNKAKANLEAAGTPFDSTMLSDPAKFGAFVTEVYKAAGCPPPTSPVGIGQPEALIAPAAAASPWAAVIVTSVLGAATGWVIEEAAEHVKKRRR